ncbi:MAG: hypothetical protein IID36_12980, partial [Planctomycetes bacterium]|nr:hypothetical protein [Planctomycetota bacterium]
MIETQTESSVVADRADTPTDPVAVEADRRNASGVEIEDGHLVAAF